MIASPAEPGTRLANLGPKILWAVALGFALLRFSALDADPSGLLTPEFFTDEGWYSLNARNQALFGRWVMDQHNVSLVLCPLHTFGLWASYSLLGVSFWSTRIVGALASVLTIGLIGWRLRKQPLAGALAAALVATQPILFALARVAYCESFQLAFVCATWFFATDERRRSRSWFLCGLFAGLAVLAKASALYAPMLALAGPFLWSAGETRGRRLRELGFVASGCALALLAILPFELRFLDILLAESGREDSVLSLVPYGLRLPLLFGLAGDHSVHPGFWAAILPLIVLVGVAGSRWVLERTRMRESDAPARAALGWIGFSLLLLFVRGIPALPERYWMNLVPPSVCLVALASSVRAEQERASGVARLWLACALLAFGPALVIRNLVQPAVQELEMVAAQPLHRFWIPALIAGACLTILFRACRLPERLARMPLLAPGLALLVLGWSCLCAGTIVWKPTFTIRDTSRALAVAGESRVLMGAAANTLSLETPYRAFVRRDLAAMKMGSGWLNRDWRALGATHGLTDRWVGQDPEPRPPVDGAILDSSFDVWPDLSGRPRRVVHLWRLP